MVKHFCTELTKKVQIALIIPGGMEPLDVHGTGTLKNNTEETTITIC